LTPSSDSNFYVHLLKELLFFNQLPEILISKFPNDKLHQNIVLPSLFSTMGHNMYTW